MIKVACFFSLLFLLSCKTTTYYIVRHAEKQANSVSADPPLTTEGEKQPLDLKNFLQNKKIKTIYSTNYTRTLATAEPTRQALGGEIKLYKPTALIELTADLKKIDDGNVLVVGHSKTVGDVVD